MKTVICVVFLVLFSYPVFAQQQGAQPGAFDYYLLTLSWSPEFCHSNPSNVECTGSTHYGFIVHGLWPENNDGTYPEDCSQQPGPSNPSQYLDIMPDPSLIQHEWATHGTCSGLSADDYFNLIRKAFQSVTIPSQFVNPSSQAALAPSKIKQDFEKSNPTIQNSGIVLGCQSYYLKQVEICLSKSLTPIPCRSLKDCRAKTIRVPPVT